MNLGKFLISPQKAAEGDDIRLIYTDGDKCGENMKVKSIITLKCKPGDVESAPVLRSMSSDGCIYEFEWFTASACVLSKTEGDDCKVEDPQAGTGQWCCSFIYALLSGMLISGAHARPKSKMCFVNKFRPLIGISTCLTAVYACRHFRSTNCNIV